MEHLSAEFFSQPHVGGEKGGNYQGFLTKLRTKLRQADPKVFYEGKHVSQFADKSLSPILKNLRGRGIGILDGEIEHLTKDESWLKTGTKKLTLEHVYEMREQLNAGKKLSEMFDLTQLQEFFAPILGPKNEIQAKAD